MTLSGRDITDMLDATWPAAKITAAGPWAIRTGLGGGQRVSAATAVKTVTKSDIAQARTMMAAIGQDSLFLIQPQDQRLDGWLEDYGYVRRDPTSVYVANVDDLTRTPPPHLSGFSMWPPLFIMTDIWADAGIGPQRLAIMHRVLGPKTAILARHGNRSAGALFVAMHGNAAMVHAAEVRSDMRRQGVGINMMLAAAQWAQDQGAAKIYLASTDANLAANALYGKLGMTIAGHYHYRVSKK